MKTIITLIAAFIFTTNTNAQNNVAFKANSAEVNIEKNANGAAITWSTAAESNTSHFEVEVSYDNKSFQTIRTVAASETTKWATKYESKFKRTYLSAGKVYYRVKTVFTDGTTTVTNASTLAITTANGISYATIN
jgi:hypothetical protein